MNQKYKGYIQPVFACFEDYFEMNEEGVDRLCPSCNKTVIDLTSKTNDEILDLLKENGSVCGRIQKSKFSYSSKRNFPLKKAFTPFLILMGVGGINKIVSAQNIKFEPPTCDTLINLEENNFVNESVKKEEYFLGVIVEKKPEYKYGGDSGLFKFLEDNLIYPKDKVEGKVYVSFTITIEGEVINSKIVKGLSPDADAEVLRVIQMLEFIPGETAGKPSSTNYMLPIVFSLK
jgi:TonB family protein